MHTTGLAVLEFIKPDIIKTIFKDGREDDNHGLELDGVDLEIIALSGIKFLKVKQSPVITLINEHQDSGQHFISPRDKQLSAFDTTLDESQAYGYSLPSDWWE